LRLYPYQRRNLNPNPPSINSENKRSKDEANDTGKNKGNDSGNDRDQDQRFSNIVSSTRPNCAPERLLSLAAARC